MYKGIRDFENLKPEQRDILHSYAQSVVDADRLQDEVDAVSLAMDSIRRVLGRVNGTRDDLAKMKSVKDGNDKTADMVADLEETVSDSLVKLEERFESLDEQLSAALDGEDSAVEKYIQSGGLMTRMGASFSSSSYPDADFQGYIDAVKDYFDKLPFEVDLIQHDTSHLDGIAADFSYSMDVNQKDDRLFDIDEDLKKIANHYKLDYSSSHFDLGKKGIPGLEELDSVRGFLDHYPPKKEKNIEMEP